MSDPVAGYLDSDGHPMYDVSPDDQQFIMFQIEDAGSGAELILIENFFEELEQRVGN